MTDTIIAQASGHGRAGIAVLRISGPQTCQIVSDLTSRDLPSPRLATRRKLYAHHNAKAELLDDAILIWMPGPASFTGEDVAELHVHGGRAIIDAVISASLETGKARLAEPGEFTRRAFENGKLDLTSAEAVSDLVDAESDAQRRYALKSYQGGSKDRIDSWRSLLIQAMGSLEAQIDFPDEDDVPPEVAAAAQAPIHQLHTDLKAELESASKGIALREGYQIALIGYPNAGKSSLLNALSNREAAIVTDTPGTTRDIVEVRLNLGGFVTILADTAGLRESRDEIEKIGIQRAHDWATRADRRLLVMDGRDDPAPLNMLKTGDIIILNKSDIDGETGRARSNLIDQNNHRILEVSTKTGSGLEALEEILTEDIQASLSGHDGIITRRRHLDLINQTLRHVEAALEAFQHNREAELISEDLRLAARRLAEITGAVDVEDLLDKIFSEFCIGK